MCFVLTSKVMLQASLLKRFSTLLFLLEISEISRFSWNFEFQELVPIGARGLHKTVNGESDSASACACSTVG
ncbi:hypothetical protein PM8797T_23444 [Gimesia maris DSM 8797]|uniref:Secreted protein n=1 Tax=Gimesia maris TaxID=122 RepID=A0ABX5YRP9_9PLAN|nr:hypothetical protein PM8797T_23234 [Gimesia maris DSM 8797]EDL59254.1 hypothetical protein PM8797T_23444 [Gimesia maris DSM 8797]QEG18209.1 hypothetical protein GmarT_40950 [Gimesia maris]QEG18245.1 hypothetical protein GmarT_41310 [Gimesia maris]